MIRPTSRKPSSRRTVDMPIVSSALESRSSEFCGVCYLILGSHERRVVDGEKVAHLRCARWLTESKAA